MFLLHDHSFKISYLFMHFWGVSLEEGGLSKCTFSKKENIKVTQGIFDNIKQMGYVLFREMYFYGFLPWLNEPFDVNVVHGDCSKQEKFKVFSKNITRKSVKWQRNYFPLTNFLCPTYLKFESFAVTSICEI